jgi:NADPH:quinone reductase-like Zn-dependent oxidoreductase
MPTAGFESVGVVAALSASTAAATGLAVGSPVATMTYGGFSEYALLPTKHVLRVPACSAATVALLTSGLTASLGLEQARRSTPDVSRASLTLPFVRASSPLVAVRHCMKDAQHTPASGS